MLPELDHSHPVPIKDQIADWMRQNIFTGIWSDNQQLLSESDLASNFQVSRGTIRKAIEILIAEKLLVRIHGKGTFVQQNLVFEQQPDGRIAGFSRDLISRGIPYQTEVFLSEVIKPKPEVVKLLALNQSGKIFHLKRCQIVQGKPVVYIENHIKYKYCQGIEELDFSKLPLYATLEKKYNFDLDWARRTYRATIASKTISKKLNIEVGAPVMHLEELYHLVGDEPVELTKAWINAEVFHITTKIKREDEKKGTLGLNR